MKKDSEKKSKGEQWCREDRGGKEGELAEMRTEPRMSAKGRAERGGEQDKE